MSTKCNCRFFNIVPKKYLAKMASLVHFWFNSEVYYWRSVASTCWSVLCLPLTLGTFLLLSEFSLTHPFVWIYAVVADIATKQFWLTLVVHAACMILVICFSLPHFSVVAEVDASYLSSYCGLLRWSRLPLMVICSLSGAVSAWSIARLIGDEFGSLTRLVDTEAYELVVLNEHHLFVVLAGIFTGLSFYKQFFQRRQYYLCFPNIQRFKYFQVRAGGGTLMWSCVWQTLHIMKYYFILYFLFGSLPKSWIKGSFNISIDSNATPIDSVFGLFSLTLFWQTYLSSLFLMFSWSFAISLIRIFHTEHLEFIVNSVMEKDKQRSLPEALACSNPALLQHLAFYDLSHLSKFSQTRRQDLLSLSQPGGHPRIWNSVSTSTLGSIKELNNQIKEENWAIMSKVSVTAQKNGAPAMAGSQMYSGDVNSSLSFRGTEPRSPGASVSPQEEEKGSQLLTKSLATLGGLPFISHLLSESPDTNSRKLFASCQLQIWAVEALSQIASKAYTEDKYGIVQSALPSIFGTLLDLHEAIEKHLKLTTAVIRRPVGSSNDPSDALLRYKLHSVNKAAIYRLVNSYRDHLGDLRMNFDYVKKLQQFKDYMV